VSARANSACRGAHGASHPAGREGADRRRGHRLPGRCRTAVLAALSFLAGCQHSEGGSTVSAPVVPGAGHEAIGAVPLGDVAGAAASHLAASIPNPYGPDNAQAIQQGHELFIRMNCAGCHGYGATGGMGPNLTDKYWRYGGVPVSIYKSIYEGRPQGMPAWNPALPPDEIWKLVAYIGSLGGAYAPEQYQAWLQGDRPGDNVAPGVLRTSDKAPKGFGAKSQGRTSSGPPSAEARPDAGGATPGGGGKP